MGLLTLYRDGPFRAILDRFGVTLIVRDYCPDLLVRLETACPRYCEVLEPTSRATC